MLKKNILRHLKGFTLIELILVISVTAALAMALLPIFDIGQVPFESAIDKLEHDIRHAQWEAMSRKTRHGVVFDANADTYSVYRSNVANIINDPLNPAEKFTVNYQTDKKFKGVQISSVDINGTSRVEFDGQGFPYDGDGHLLVDQGTITLTRGGAPVVITIEPNTGKVGN